MILPMDSHNEHIVVGLGFLRFGRVHFEDLIFVGKI